VTAVSLRRQECAKLDLMTESAQQDASKQAPEPGAGQADTEPGTAQDGGGKPELDEVKRKFREALDRKRQIHAEGSGQGGRDAGKIHGAHGPAAGRRQFRRKSG
jgi:hypothetical protein